VLRRTSVTTPETMVKVCRDPDDDFLLALAVAGQAEVLVTRDEDLLALRTQGRTEIIHVAEFLRRLSNPEWP
jgi:predicted nucleic acid-binding protein